MKCLVLLRCGRAALAAAVALSVLSCVLGAEEEAESIFLPAPRALRQNLSRAERAVEEGRYGDAVTELGALLAHLLPDANRAGEGEPQDYFLGSPGDGTHRSLKSEAQRLLGSMPARGRELYELQFGAEARALLESAVQAGDMQKLTDVTRRFFHTRAGYEATVLLGRLHMDRGRPLAASLCLQRVLDASGAASQFEPELSLLLAACHLQACRPERAQQILAQLRQRYPAVRMRIGDRQIDSLPLAAKELAWLEEQFGSPRATRGPMAADWLLYRGDAARNAQSMGGVPLRSSRWQAPTATDPGDEELITGLSKGFADEGLPAISSLQPLAVGDVILMRTPERLLAIDFRTGKRVWEYPWWDLSYQRTAPFRGSSTRRMEQEQRKLQLTQRLWYDAPYGQVSSDGERVFLLDELRYATPNRFQWIPGRLGGRQANPDAPLAHNQLVALDLARQGALRWMVGGETGLDEPRLMGVFFLGPPLPLFGQLYAMAEISGEIRLVVLDADTGQLEWSQQLAHVEAFTIVDNPQRRLAGASPSFADGVLVCPTSAGAVVAVDLATRSLLWGFQYAPASPDPSSVGIMHAYPGQVLRPGSRWMDGTAMLVDGAVVLTPPESNKILCLDLFTGRPKWPPLDRSGDLADMLFVGGLWDGKIVLVGHHGLTAVRLADGKLAWPQPLELDEGVREMPSGRGYISEGCYFLPTTNRRLLKIDLADGRVVASEKTDHVLGNLICHREQVVDQGVDRLSACYQIEPLRRRVAERLRATPQDAWALARQGELLVNDGDIPGALASLRRAQSLASEDLEVRSLVVKTYLTALREDFPRHRAMAPEIMGLIDQPADHIEYLRLTAAGLQAAGEFKNAWNAYLQLAEVLEGEARHSTSALTTTLVVDSAWSVRMDRWIQARLADLNASADEPLRNEISDAVRRRLEMALKGTREDRQRFTSLFGFHPLADQASLQSARDALAAGDWLSAEWELGRLEESGDPLLAAPATALGAKTLVQAGQVQLASDQFQKLAEQWGDTICDEGKTGRQLAEAAGSRESSVRAGRSIASWPWGRAMVSESKEGLGPQAYRRLYIIPFRERKGGPTELGCLVLDGTGGTVVARDRGGQAMFPIKLAAALSFYTQQPGMSYASTIGHLTMIVLADQFAVVDGLRAARNLDDCVLWRESLTQSFPDISAQPVKLTPREYANPLDPTAGATFHLADSSDRPLARMGPLTRSGVCYLKVRTLICADPRSGAVNWSRRDVAQGSDVFGDESFLFVVEPNGGATTILSAVDGRVLGHCRLPEPSRRWTTRGRFLLAWSEKSEGIELSLHNAANQTVVWSQVLPKGSRGTLVGEESVALLQPDGKFVIRSLREGRILAESAVEPEQNLKAIFVLVTPDQYLLATSSETSGWEALGGGQPMVQVKGRLYAFNRRTGQSQWQVPAYIDGYGLPGTQPQDNPALWFLRQYAGRESNVTPSAGGRTAVLCIDKRTGRLLLERADLPSQASYFEIASDPVERVSRLAIRGFSFIVRFTSEPTPPEPPAQTGTASSAVAPESNPLGDFANSLFKALFGGPEKQTQPDEKTPNRGAVPPPKPN